MCVSLYFNGLYVQRKTTVCTEDVNPPPLPDGGDCILKLTLVRIDVVKSCCALPPFTLILDYEAKHLKCSLKPHISSL